MKQGEIQVEIPKELVDLMTELQREIIEASRVEVLFGAYSNDSASGFILHQLQSFWGRGGEVEIKERGAEKSGPPLFLVSIVS